jgi:hypothetical protein
MSHCDKLVLLTGNDLQVTETGVSVTITAAYGVINLGTDTITDTLMVDTLPVISTLGVSSATSWLSYCSTIARSVVSHCDQFVFLARLYLHVAFAGVSSSVTAAHGVVDLRTDAVTYTNMIDTLAVIDTLRVLVAENRLCNRFVIAISVVSHCNQLVLLARLYLHVAFAGVSSSVTAAHGVVDLRTDAVTYTNMIDTLAVIDTLRVLIAKHWLCNWGILEKGVPQND